MMYYGPGIGGWNMTFMIIGNLLFWGLLIFVAVLVARYVREGKIAAVRPRRDHRGGVPASLADPVWRFGGGSQVATRRAHAHNLCRVRPIL